MRKWRAALALVLAACATAASAAYPEKPITLVVPFAAGSATDSVARILSKSLGARLGQPVLVDNKPGANGQIGVTHAARAAPDGYTLLMATSGTHSTNPALISRLPYDPVKDFQPVLLVGEVPFALVVNNGLPVKTTAQLIEHVKSNPDKLSFAYASPTGQIAGETFVRLASLKATGVAYKSSPQAAMGLIGGETQFYFIDFGSGLQFIKQGQMRVLGIAGVRTETLPGVPALSETLPEFQMTSWNGIFFPAGTPKAVVEHMNREVKASLADPEVRKSLQAIGFEILGTGSPEEFEKLVADELVKWKRWAAGAGVQAR